MRKRKARWERQLDRLERNRQILQAKADQPSVAAEAAVRQQRYRDHQRIAEDPLASAYDRAFARQAMRKLEIAGHDEYLQDAIKEAALRRKLPRKRKKMLFCHNESVRGHAIWFSRDGGPWYCGFASHRIHWMAGMNQEQAERRLKAEGMEWAWQEWLPPMLRGEQQQKSPPMPSVPSRCYAAAGESLFIKAAP